ncbi:GxxExxY protein, partial [Bacteroidia bacterium]|nr:GxxExxY protein [Bacteroidia bacterium]
GNPIDFIIEDMLIVNILTEAQIYEHEIQRTLKVVRTNDYRLGFVINFNSTLLKNGIRRVSNHNNSLP